MVISVLLLVLLAAQFIFQTFYFEKFYTFVKEQGLMKDMRMLNDKMSHLPQEEIDQELLKYAREKGVTVGVVNVYGRPIYGFDIDTQYPFVDLIDRYEQKYRVYLNHFSESKDFVENLKEAREVKVWGQLVQSNYSEIYPIYIQLDGKIYTGGKRNNLKYLGKLFTGKLSILQTAEIEGEVDYIYIPERQYGVEYREARLLNEVSRLLETDDSLYELFDSNTGRIYQSLDSITGINNMIGLLPVRGDPMPMLLVAMVSLQSISEAAGVMNQYFIIIFSMIFLISLIAVYIFTRWITKPLIHLNDVTEKLSNLDFSDMCKVTRNDEVGSLADNINQMSRKLQLTLDQLKEDLELRSKLDEERKRFIADVSHELKTPLTVIRGTCEGLVDGVYDKNQNEYFELMLEEINDMGQMVQDLLEISRVENEEVLRKEIFDLSEIVYKVHSHLKSLVIEKELRIILELEEGFINADEKKIETVIRNIYNNAIFYTPRGQEIHIKMLENETKFKLSVENYGVFIKESELEKIWDAFYRVDQSRNKELGGSGLGLYIVKQILEKHESQYGIRNTHKGVEVWFEIESVSIL